jgi:hypothetical protein
MCNQLALHIANLFGKPSYEIPQGYIATQQQGLDGLNGKGRPSGMISRRFAKVMHRIVRFLHTHALALMGYMIKRRIERG